MKNNYKEIIQYKIDKLLSKGTVVLVFSLILLSSIVVVIIGLLAFYINQAWSNGSSTFSIWKTMNFLLDAGNLASEESSALIIGLMGLVTLIGVFFTSILIGIINNGIQTKILDLRRGNSKILEHNHVVIIGYNDSVFSLLSEIILANANHKHQVVVLLALQDKFEVEEAIRERIQDFKTTTVIVHSGNTAEINSIEKCSVETSRAILINESNDFDTIRSTMAVASILDQFKDKTHSYMIAVIQEKHNVEVAKIASKGYAEVLYFKDVISRILAQTTIQPGLSRVYTELFDFEGDEIYIESFPELIGKTFAEAASRFETSTVIGIRNGVCKLNPNKESVITEKDSLILIADDDGSSKVTWPTNSDSKIDNGNLSLKQDVKDKMENVLILGSNSLIHLVVRELDRYLAKGSVVTIATLLENKDDVLKTSLQNNIKIKHIEADIYDPTILESLLQFDYQNILILSQETSHIENSDAHTILLLLHLRNLIEKLSLQISITTEMKDIINQKLLSISQANDFVVSQNLISLMVTQISENRDLIHVFSDLLDEDGSEIYIKPAVNYIKPGIRLSVREISLFLMDQGMVFIGFKQTLNTNGKPDVIICTNPKKSDLLMIDHTLDFIVISES